MTQKKTDKQQLIDKAGDLFRIKGYHNTSIADIAKSCDLSKGSVYHYIDSKEELVLLVVQNLTLHVREKLFKPALNKAINAKQRLQALSQNILSFYQETNGGCLVGNLALETVDSMPAFTPLYQNFFNEWLEVLMSLLQSRYPEQEAQAQAEAIIAKLQGALLLSRTFNEPKYLARVCEEMALLLND